MDGIKNIFWLYVMIAGFFGLLGFLFFIRACVWRDIGLIIGGIALTVFAVFMLSSG